jgi:hypothetical protein
MKTTIHRFTRWLLVRPVFRPRETLRALRLAVRLLSP